MVYIPISEQISESEWFITRSKLSPAAAAIFAQTEATLAKNGDAIEYLALGTGLNKGKVYGLEFKCKKGSGTFGMNTNAKADDKVGFKYSMKGEGDQTKYLTSFLKTIDCFGRLNEKTFVIETDNFKNPTTIKLTDESDASISMTLVNEKVAY